MLVNLILQISRIQKQTFTRGITVIFCQKPIKCKIICKNPTRTMPRSQESIIQTFAALTIHGFSNFVHQNHRVFAILCIFKCSGLIGGSKNFSPLWQHLVMR
ncbi:hypothetical protein RF11_07397 [Thelohanellus kitauei]|uniref:Uncharacterized protein n=1 Tax=Thelohanellus kitauei TaxID=669202 RepID=A0A0C2J5M6_THEKT|nr:hypothetical protein RF11_07397 [Thelohanellus kitauei]